MNIGENIKLLRVAKNMKQSELSEKASISRRALINYETGARTPNIEVLKSIANALNVSINQLIDENECINIGDKIKYFRQQRNLSRESLSNLLEISVHTLSKYEQGKREPTYEMLFKICNELKISIIDLFGLFEEDLSYAKKTASSLSVLVCEKIKYYREVENISQRELGRRIGKTGQYISHIEKTKPIDLSINLLNDIANALNTNLINFLKNDNNTNVTDKKPPLSIYDNSELMAELERRLR